MGSLQFTWQALREATQGLWTVPPDDSVSAGVSATVDDSRCVVDACLFVAIKGELVDGHAYIKQALDRGARALCVCEPLPESVLQRCRQQRIAVLAVPDSLCAFQALARAHRRSFEELTVIGITGSCGKTSTKVMISTVLERAFPGAVLSTTGNTNNHFGVPRNLLRLTAAHRVAVIEMGTNHPGEIALLAALAEPTIGVVSNIGAAHLEFFGDLAGVAEEKGNLLALTALDGIAIYHAGAAHVETLVRKAGKRKTITFGSASDCDIRVDYEGLQHGQTKVNMSWRQPFQEHVLRWRIGGAHQALNAGAAAAVAAAVGMTTDEVIAGLAQVVLPTMRMEVCTTAAGVHWLNDAYNANPDSMRAGIEWFAEVSAEADENDRIVVLGDMLELGTVGAREHEKLLNWVRERFPGAIILTVGPLMKQASREADIRSFQDSEACLPVLRTMQRPGAWIFLKASRGIGLETLVPEITESDA